MKIYLATDHAGFELKEKIKTYLLEKKYEIEDCGAFSFNKDDDYTDFIPLAAKKVSENPENRAIILGGNGENEAVTANKFKNVRCALFYGPVLPVQPINVENDKSSDPYALLKLTRDHDNSNILSLGARFLTDDQAINAVEIWLNTPFSNAERHERRIEQIKKIEENNFK